MVEVTKTVTSADGRRRVHFLRRSDGLFQYSEEVLWDDEDQGQNYSIWKPQYPLSGVFPDEIVAEAEARRSLGWLSLPK
jgi:hypothetical protein